MNAYIKGNTRSSRTGINSPIQAMDLERVCYIVYTGSPHYVMSSPGVQNRGRFF